jgi:hypothetical protein
MLMHTDLRDVTEVRPSVRPDGRGTLKFESRGSESWLTEVSSWSAIGRIVEGFLNPPRTSAAAFEMIPGAQEVSRSITQARDELLSAAG